MDIVARAMASKANSQLADMANKINNQVLVPNKNITDAGKMLIDFKSLYGWAATDGVMSMDSEYATLFGKERLLKFKNTGNTAASLTKEGLTWNLSDTGTPIESISLECYVVGNTRKGYTPDWDSLNIYLRSGSSWGNLWKYAPSVTNSWLKSGKITLQATKSEFTSVGTPAWDNIQAFRINMLNANGGNIEIHLARLMLNIKGGGYFVLHTDGGWATNLTTIAPLCERYGIPITAFVTLNQIGTQSKYMTESQIKELARRGHEISNHTVTHTEITPTMSLGDIKADIAPIVEWLNSRGYYRGAQHMVYAVRGTSRKDVHDMLRNELGILTAGGTNGIYVGNPISDLYNYNRIGLSASSNLESIKKAATDAANAKSTLVAFVHTAGGTDPVEDIPVATLEAFLAHCVSIGLRPVTQSQWYDIITGRTLAYDSF